jgi:hypothetical protein
MMKPLERYKKRWEKILKQIRAELKFDFATFKSFPRLFPDYSSVAYNFFVFNFQPQNFKMLLTKNTYCSRYLHKKLLSVQTSII